MDAQRTARAIIAHGIGVKTDDPNFFTPRDDRKGPMLSDTERRAYQAAWRIDREPVPETLNSLACPASRHARYIDHMARIIAEEMGR